LNVKDMAHEVTIGSVTGRISELAVRLAISRESALIKGNLNTNHKPKPNLEPNPEPNPSLDFKGHEKLLGDLTKWVGSDESTEAVKCRPSELLQDLDLIKSGKVTAKLSWWKRVALEACLYEAAAYENSFKASVGSYMSDCASSPHATSVTDARLLTLVSLCSHGLGKEDYHTWHSPANAFSKRHGLKASFLLGNLEATGMLKSRAENAMVTGLTSPAMLDVASTMGMLEEEAVHSRGWLPLSSRIVEIGLKGRWGDIGRGINKAGENWHHKGSPFSMNPSLTTPRTCSLVVFLGGCMESEVVTSLFPLTLTLTLTLALTLTLTLTLIVGRRCACSLHQRAQGDRRDYRHDQ